MDNFVPDWLDLKTKELNKSEKLNNESTNETVYRTFSIEDHINNHGLRPNYGTSNKIELSNVWEKLQKKSLNTKPVKIEYKEPLIKEDNEEFPDDYTIIDNFVEKYYFAPKVPYTPEIYISSSDDELSDIDDFNYN